MNTYVASRQAGESRRRKTQQRHTLSTVRELVRGNCPRGGTGAVRWKRNEGVSQANNRGRSVPDTGSSTCKGPEAGGNWACSKDGKEGRLPWRASGPPCSY